MAEAAIEVGLSVAIDPIQPIEVSVADDGGETVRRPLSDAGLGLRRAAPSVSMGTG